MTVSVPKDTPEAWFAGFAAGLAQDQALFGVSLLGGDTTSTPGPISLSLTIIGHVAPGRPSIAPAPSRRLDRVTGTIGDGALGLRCAGAAGRPNRPSAGRYRLPQPRVGFPCPDRLGRDGRSEGWCRTSGIICRASGVGANWRGRGAAVDAARAAGPDWLITCLTGGDDYEVLMAVPPATGRLRRRPQAGWRHAVGHFTLGPPEVMVRRPAEKPLPWKGAAGVISSRDRTSKR